MTLLDRVVAHLAGGQIPSALIGAAALAVHGVSRSTLDQDLLVVDRRVLDARFWRALPSDVAAGIRIGDADDPLAGVVRVTAPPERDVDVVVGRHAWQAEIIDRATPLPGTALRVARCEDLIVLKLYAGGSQDGWDIEQLLALDPAAAARVEPQIEVLPPHSRALWHQLRRGRSQT